MTVELVIPEWPAPKSVRAIQTTRGGGVSVGSYASLNLALHVGDDPDHVAENRRRLAATARLPAEPGWLEQVHETRVVDLDGPWSGPADAAVTRKRGTVGAVMTADCLPVLLADTEGGCVGIAHAGWRGLAGGVVGRAVAALDVEPERIVAWLGPAIGPSAYEVGGEVRAAFVDREPAAARAFASNEAGRWQADLYALARLALNRAGVTRIHGGGECTHTRAARYFSHRRDAPCGRMATLIWLEH